MQIATNANRINMQKTPQKQFQAKLKNLRANDQTSFYAKGRKDFTVRRHSFFATRLYRTILSAILIAAGVTFIVYKNTLLGAVLCILLGIGLYIYAKHIERLKKLLTTTEFLNALFSSIVGAGHKFCIIVNIDSGDIVYMNNQFQQMFPEMLPMPKRELKTLLEVYKVDESAGILSALKAAKKTSITAQTQSGNDKKASSILWSIEPIARPSGFSIIRGQ